MYGNNFIETLKEEKLYGDLFSYDEYQRCKTCETAEDFSAFLASTNIDTLVFPEARHTYEYFRLKQKRKEAQKSLKDFFAILDIFSILLLPLFPFWAFYWYTKAQSFQKDLDTYKSTHYPNPVCS